MSILDIGQRTQRTLLVVMVLEDGVLLVCPHAGQPLPVHHVAGGRPTGVKVRVVNAPGTLIGPSVTNQRLTMPLAQVLDDVPHVAEVAGGGGEHGLHADHAPVRAALTLTHTREDVRGPGLDSGHVRHVACPHLDAARHRGGFVLTTVGLRILLISGSVVVFPCNLDQENCDDDHEKDEDGDDTGGDSDKVLHPHFHHQGVTSPRLHRQGEVCHHAARLVLRHAEEGAVLLEAGVGQHQLAAGAEAALELV